MKEYKCPKCHYESINLFTPKCPYCKIKMVKFKIK